MHTLAYGTRTTVCVLQTLQKNELIQSTVRELVATVCVFIVLYELQQKNELNQRTGTRTIFSSVSLLYCILNHKCKTRRTVRF